MCDSEKYEFAPEGQLEKPEAHISDIGSTGARNMVQNESQHLSS